LCGFHENKGFFFIYHFIITSFNENTKVNVTLQTLHCTLVSWIGIYFYLVKIIINVNVADFSGMTVCSIIQYI